MLALTQQRVPINRRRISAIVTPGRHGLQINQILEYERPLVMVPAADRTTGTTPLPGTIRREFGKNE
jgi:hypothetical protein